MSDLILSIENVTKTFAVGSKKVHALRDVSVKVRPGSCHAIVGESGSGKSTLANIILGIYPHDSGNVCFESVSLPNKRENAHRRDIQLVQQNPSSAINPRRSVGASIRLALDVHNIGEKSSRKARVLELLEEVGLDPNVASRSPSSLSGGQKQRVAIARALACKPKLLVLDEPTSALDVLVQAQVLALLDQLRRDYGLTYFFITHDLAVVRNIADDVSVFKAGEIVETGEVEAIFDNPKHNYTRALIAAIPVVTKEEVAMRNKLKSEAQPQLFDMIFEDAKSHTNIGLFTVMKRDPETEMSSRSYTTMPDVYPVSGMKAHSPNKWTETVLDGKRSYLGQTLAELDTVFPDAELIGSLGLGSCLNVPVFKNGEIIGTMNFLKEENGFSAQDVEFLENLTKQKSDEIVKLIEEMES